MSQLAAPNAARGALQLTQVCLRIWPQADLKREWTHALQLAYRESQGRKVRRDELARLFHDIDSAMHAVTASPPAARPSRNGNSWFIPLSWCQSCDQMFTPARADSRYCSPACRQRAYRNRSKGNA